MLNMTARKTPTRQTHARKSPSKSSPSRSTKRRRFSWRSFIATRLGKLTVAATILVLLVAAYILGALAAASAYSRHLSSGNYDFSGHITFTGSDFLSPLNSDMTFNGSNGGTKIVNASSSFTGNWAGHEYSGSSRLTDGRLYFNLSGPVMPVIRYRQGSFLLPLKDSEWYSAKADESLYNNLCAHNQSSTLEGKLAFYRLIRNLKINPSPVVNFWSSIGSSPATHLSATLSGDQLAAVWTAYGKAAPPGCADPNTIGFTADDLKHVSTHVDLYSAHNKDQAVISLNDKTLGAKATITLITSNYGHAKPAPVPVKFTDLNALYASFGLN
jgi:hypothetical protein